MIRTLYPSYWFCNSKDFYLESVQYYIGHFITRYDSAVFSIQVGITDNTIDINLHRLEPMQTMSGIQGRLFMGFSNKADVETLLSNTIIKHKLTLYYNKEVDEAFYNPIKDQFMTIYSYC